MTSEGVGEYLASFEGHLAKSEFSGDMPVGKKPLTLEQDRVPLLHALAVDQVRWHSPAFAQNSNNSVASAGQGDNADLV